MAVRQKRRKRLKNSNIMFDCEQCGKTIFIITDIYRGCQHYQVADLMIKHYRKMLKAE